MFFILVLLYVLSFHNFINMNRFYHLCWFCCLILAKLDEEIHELDLSCLDCSYYVSILLLFVLLQSIHQLGTEQETRLVTKLVANHLLFRSSSARTILIRFNFAMMFFSCSRAKIQIIIHNSAEYTSFYRL